MTVRHNRKSHRTGSKSLGLVKRAHERHQRRKLLLENLEHRRVMAVGPALASIQPNNGTSFNLSTPNVQLSVAPRELTFNFTNEQNFALNPNTLQGIQLLRSGFDGEFAADSVQVSPGYLAIGDTNQEVVMRFADPLPDDTYRIVLVGQNTVATPVILRDAANNPYNGGFNDFVQFELDLGAQVLAVVPQPVDRAANGTLVQRGRDIDVYFNTDTLNTASAQNPAFYQLILTGNTVSPLDDAANTFNPTQVVYNAAQNKATLTFASPLHVLNPRNEAIRLRIGTDQALDGSSYAATPANDPLSTFDGARDLGPLTANRVFRDFISAKPYDIQWPGGNDDPGHRDVPVDDEKHLGDGQGDGVQGIQVRYYNFRRGLGTISDGRGGQQQAFNLITENQKQRAREIFELYSRYSGVQFIESQDQGITVATGDLRLVDDEIISEPGGVAGLAGGGLAIMDSAESWLDGYGESWFQTAMHEIGHAIGLGHTYDLAPLTVQGDDGALGASEPVFPGDNDIVHLQRIYRPEGQDIDMYRFVIPGGQRGTFTAETFSERLQNGTTLDTYLRLFKDGTSGRELVAVNDDYFSKDSKLELELTEGTYYIGVSAKGNEQYDPKAADSGIGGTSEGEYRLNVNFRPTIAAANTIVDTTGKPIDGDADGKAGGTYNFWFKTAAPILSSEVTHAAPRTLFVDSAFSRGAPAMTNGSLAAPFKTVQAALSASIEGDIVRIVGNGGDDGNLATVGDNYAYQIGFNQVNNAPLRDGSSLVVPKNVTVMVDAGAIFQMRGSRIQVGSVETTAATDKQGGALQILGTPNAQVVFTSFNDATIGKDENSQTTLPARGDWGGILFRNDLDRANGRFDWEERGIFLNHVNYADIRYGGGSVTLGGSQTSILTPIHMVDARPTVTNNVITRSAEAAMSATPNSFEETNFHEPRYQIEGNYLNSFNVDYGRIGPEIHGNRFVSVEPNNLGVNITHQNSINGLFVRMHTPAGSTLQQLTVPGRFNDTDIVHVISENLVIRGVPGGPIREGGTPTAADPTITTARPPVNLVILSQQAGGGSLTAGVYRYRVVYVDQFGNEGLISAERVINVTNNNSSVQLSQLPVLPAGSSFVGRRIYRSLNGGDYRFVDQVPDANTTFIDRGAAPTFNRVIASNSPRLVISPAEVLWRSRPDASLRIDPNVVVKLDGARIDIGMGATLTAEGLDGQEVVFTSLSDDSFGGGGTFDTRGDNRANPANEGEWGGIYAGPNSRLSLDYASVRFAGGLTRVEGEFGGFNAVEVHQADARIAHTLFEHNGDGLGGTQGGRRGRGANGTGSIFVRGAQPIIVENTIRNNFGAAININVNALNATNVVDTGRQTGLADRLDGHLDNNGPLIDGNRLQNNGREDEEGWNGMIVRGGVLTTEGVWDDTDIAHIVFDNVNVTDVHTYGGLRLESSATESLVVKSLGATAGFTANGRPLETDDRLGGIIQVLGQPGFPVIMTSFRDDTASAGLMPDGSPMFDTNNDGAVLAPTNSPFADVIVVMDETITMASAQQFSAQFIQDLEAGLVAAGVGGTAGPNRYGLFGFGGGSAAIEAGHAIPVGAGGNVWGSAPEYAAATSQLVVNGAIEDGYRAIELMTPLYQTRPNAAKFVILVSDEDRDNEDGAFTYQTTLSTLQSNGFKLQGILDVDVVDQNNQSALALDAAQNAYGDDGAGGYTITPNGQFSGGFGTTVPDYGNLVHATGGIAGDINQISSSQQTANLFSQILVSSLVEQAGGGTRGAPGDWQGITIDQYAHDRNVDAILEHENFTGSAGDPNGTPLRSQDLGQLAPNEKGGDENRRLGFTVHGSINAPNDVDVYSFRGTAGTQVWLDIDRTSYALDSIVELIDSSGFVVARSNDSLRETAGTQGLHGLGKVMQSTPPFAGRDFYSTNQRDAGMRVVLPGTAGVTSEYFVRVRSNTDSTNSLTAGQTMGAYQLQIRLQEQDEFAGTVVRYADIRNATNGIAVLGQPIHSPLAGEHADIDGNGANNDSQGAAQNLGNLLNVDRGATSIAGLLNTENDVDWYQFTLDINQIQGFGASLDPTGLLYSMIFDLDYADGLGRANTVLNVFDDQGRLVLSSRDSNIADDQPAPLSASGTNDLSRGSVGTADPYIGPAYMPAGFSGAFGNNSRTYYVAVSSDAQLPSQWDQFFSPTPTNALVRFQPVNSVKRIVEDHINEPVNLPGTADLVPVLIDTSSPISFHLGDVSMFISKFSSGGRIGRDFVTSDPFTGADETFIGNFSGVTINDVAFRNDEELFGFGKTPVGQATTDANTGTYYQINTGTGALTGADDGMITYELDANGALVVAHDIGGGTRVGWGVHYEALVFSQFEGPANGDIELLAVGSRGDEGFIIGANNNPASSNFHPSRNILYNLSPTTGTPVRNNGPARETATDPDTFYGALTSGLELGYIDTNTTLGGTLPGRGGRVTGLAEVGGHLYAIDDLGGLYRVDTRGGGANDGMAGAIANNRNGAFNDPNTVRTIETHYVENSRFELAGLNFQSLTAGPQDVEEGRYADLLFGTASNGRMYAFNTAGELQPIFEGGATSIQLRTREPNVSSNQTLTGVTGVAFSNLDRNLWHVTPYENNVQDINGQRQNDPGHGYETTWDGSIVPPPATGLNPPAEAVEGHSSLYFGAAEQLIDVRDVRGAGATNTYDAAGGAYGSVVSKEFSLRGHSAADQPVLYYTYFLDSEEAYSLDNTFGLPGRQTRDAVKVFIAGNDGNWTLIAGDQEERFTAPPPRAGVPSPAMGSRMWDSTGNWRQVRINLGDFAGQDNLRLRFDFSTAGEMNVGDRDTTGSELRAVAGHYIDDGEILRIDGQNYEFDSGRTIVTSAGSQIQYGQTFTIRKNNVQTVFEFIPAPDPAKPNGVVIPSLATRTAREVAVAVTAAITNRYGAANAPKHLNDNRVNLNFLIDPATDDVTENSPGLTLEGTVGVAAGNIRVEFHRGMTRDEVAQEIDFVLEASLTRETLVVRGTGTAFDDGETFVLQVGGQPLPTFEIEKSLADGGLPGTAFGRIPVLVNNSMSAGQVANAIFNAVNGYLAANPQFGTAAYSTFDQARVQLNGTGVERFSLAPTTLPLELDETSNIVKTDDDLIRIINHTVNSAGPLGFDNQLEGDYFPGEIREGFESAVRGQNNAFEGVYIDDIVIGLAERGEMVLNSSANTVFNRNTQELQPDQNLTGTYQLEIRRGPDYALPGLGETVVFPVITPIPGLREVPTTIDSNDRLNRSTAIDVPTGADIRDGQTLILSDGVNEVRFEFDLSDAAGNSLSGGVQQGNIAIPFTANDTPQEVALTLRDLGINGPDAQAVLTVSAQLADGARPGQASTNARLNIVGDATFRSHSIAAPEANDFRINATALDLNEQSSYVVSATIGDNAARTLAAHDVDMFRVFLLAGEQIYVDVDSATVGSSFQPYLRVFDASAPVDANSGGSAPGETGAGEAYLEFRAPTDGFYYIGVSGQGNQVYTADVGANSNVGSTGQYWLEISRDRQLVVENNLPYGDENLHRDQGQLILEGNRISNSSQWGILVNNGTRDNGTAPHAGPTRHLRERNDIVPGTVIVNNVIFNNGSGGIRFSGNANAAAQELGAIPFGRIVNNTLFNRGTNGIGIQVDERASPTLLNNIVSQFATGITVDASSQIAGTVVGGTVYKGNAVASTGVNNVGAMFLTQTEPLFVDTTTNNFYLLPGSKAIDSSIDSLLDRAAMVTVRNPLGIPPSPILAPEKDGVGLVRVDDPTAASPGGSGENVYKDRGALDRSDFVGPTALLINPLDNDVAGIDSDPASTFIVVAGQTLLTFDIQLLDEGSGIDPATVTAQTVTVQDSAGQGYRTLLQGTDYTFDYDSTNKRIILTPTAGVWSPGRDYRITLDRSITDATPAAAIRDMAGNLLQPNRGNGSVVFDIFHDTAVDWGDAPATYPVLRSANGASHERRGNLRLGTQMSVDTDGKPSPRATGDSFDDGLTGWFIAPGVESYITVLGQGTGILDAWLDSNRNGTWEANEKLTFINGATIGNNVARQLRFRFGNAADPKGDTALRLRYSSAGIATPTGSARDGEVEDYFVTMMGPQYQNPNNRFDVDNNGFVQSRDALLIINLLSNYDTDGNGVINPNTDLPPALQSAPPYYDVTGDGLITRADALFVVNEINNPSAQPAAAARQYASSSVVYEPKPAATPGTTAIDAVLAVNDHVSLAEDGGALAIDVLANDRANQQAKVVLKSFTQPAQGGTVTLNNNGTPNDRSDDKLIFTPAAHFNGEVKFSYVMNDTSGAGADSTAQVTVNVEPRNDAPTAGGNYYPVQEDVTRAVAAPGVLANDGDVDGDALTAVLVKGPAHGKLTLNANGSFTYTPNANFFGKDTFQYRAKDTNGALSPVRDVILDVKPRNDAPTAGGNYYAAQQNVTRTVAAPGLLANDRDIEGDALTAVLVKGPAHGKLTLNANGSFSYTPNANFFGKDTFQYRAKDAKGALSPVRDVILDVKQKRATNTATVASQSPSNASLAALLTVPTSSSSNTTTSTKKKTAGAQPVDDFFAQY
jgi:hypothetical protein